MTDNVPVLEVRELRKTFGSVTAVDGVDFAVQPGEVFGFLGPNGAGKTTTIKLLTGLARPDSGTIAYHGVDRTKTIKAAQGLFGVVADSNNLYPELTGRENLEFCAALYGVEPKEARRRAGELLERFALSGAAGRRFGGYSRGMGRRLCIAAALIHRPRLLFLDEPTTGIDVPNAREIRRMLAGLGDEGTTIFLTTHYLEEAERLCDRVAFIVDGRIVRCDSVCGLLEERAGRCVLELSVEPISEGLLDELNERDVTGAWSRTGNDRLRYETEAEAELAPVASLLSGLGVRLLEARRVRPSLEDVFVAVTGLEAEKMKQEKGKRNG